MEQEEISSIKKIATLLIKKVTFLPMKKVTFLVIKKVSLSTIKKKDTIFVHKQINKNFQRIKISIIRLYIQL